MMKGMRQAILLVLYAVMGVQVVQAQGVLYGKVVDSRSKEPLIGAIVGYGRTRVLTDTYGFYSLQVRTGEEVSVEYSHIGYKPLTISLSLTGDRLMDIELKEKQVELPDVVVKGASPAREIGKTHIPIATLNTTPALLAEADPVKVFQRLPGIQPANEGQSNSVIRGQAPEMALLTVDGISLYNSNHAMGLLSTVNAEAVKEMTLYSGYQPAALGGKMGGVLSVKTKDGDMQHLRGNVALGVISARANVEIPIVKDKLSLSLAGRRSMIDLFIPLFNKDEEDKTNFYFYDANAKLTYKPTSRLTLALSGLLSGDKLWMQSKDKHAGVEGSQDWTWGTYGGSLVANYIVSPKWSSQVTLSASDFRRREELAVKEANDATPLQQSHSNDVSEISALWSNKLYLSNDLMLQSGIGATLRRASIAHTDEVSYREGNASIDLQWQITPGLRSRGGLRLEYPYSVISPRLALSADLTSRTSGEISYSRTSQRMLTATTNSSILQSDVWFAPDGHFLPPTSDQVSVTLSGTPGDWLHYSVGGYYTRMDRIVEYKEGFTRLESYSQLPERVSVGRGYSYGLEALLEVKWQGLDAGASYSYSRVRHLFGDINGGEWYRPYYDRPHRLRLSASYHLGKRWLLSAVWHYSSGSVQTIPLESLPIGQPYPGQPSHLIEQVSERGNYRLHSYHRLDLAVSYRHHGWTVALSAYNAYNRQNVYRAVIDTEEDGTRTFKGMTLLPIVPGLNIKYSY